MSGDRIQKEEKRLCLRSLGTGAVYTAVLLLLIAAALYVPAAVYVTALEGNREIPVYCVQTQEKKIALTFDAAWGNEDTDTLLGILEKYEIKATFFMTGGWVEAYPEEVQAIAAAGHDLGNHSMTHPRMSELGEEKIREELMSVHEKVKELTGQDMFLFRAPYGDYNNQVIRTAKECGYYSIQWDVDSLDWRDYGAEAIIRTVTQSTALGNGSIILMHNGAKYTKDALESVIIALKDAGYEFVPVSGLIYREGYHIDNTGRQIPDQGSAESQKSGTVS